MLTEIRELISSPFKMENEICKNALLLGPRCYALKSQWKHPPPPWIYHSLNYLTCASEAVVQVTSFCMDGPRSNGPGERGYGVGFAPPVDLNNIVGPPKNVLVKTL